jgi:hypothetical protein
VLVTTAIPQTCRHRELWREAGHVAHAQKKSFFELNVRFDLVLLIAFLILAGLATSFAIVQIES